ncbi:polysaccharide pyruvyl transferase family protein [Agromyces aureus]|uniref:polysaccharide pyruvyl transferase family protein n=1 Tax=Agromyces aureus TaxID=453304 RepID=UPI001D1156E7|nr:polysaccharide pyruvyl transferase family protein [Agromyces aureus]
MGSVLHFAKRGDHIWGSGINGKVARPLRVKGGELTIHAVRGPRTRRYLMDHGHDVPPIYGDPALLISHVDKRFRLAGAEKQRQLLVVPNLNDMPRYRSHPQAISPLADPLEIARLISSSEFVVGSSLHAMVLADLFGVPCRPLMSAYENDFKYDDYYLGTGRELPEFARDVEHAIRLGGIDELVFRPEPILRAFPHELFRAGGERTSEFTPVPIE